MKKSKENSFCSIGTVNIMKALNVFLLFMLITSAMAQTQIPEGGFNNWNPNSINTYYEPAGDWWATLNPLVSIGAPVTVYPTSDAHSGEYAAQLETKLWGTLLLSGLLVSGDFILSAPYIQNGKPFTDTPSKFKGWYKYISVNGDSAGIAAILTRYNTGKGKQDTVATAITAITENASTYTEFEIDFEYLMPGINPDSIIIVFTSSGDGGNFQGEVGSTLTIDDISLEYPFGIQESLMPEFIVEAFPSPATNNISFKFYTTQAEKLFCFVYSLNGQMIQSFSPVGKEHQMDVSNWSQGKYIIQVYKDSKLASSAKFIVNH
jgi:hypothetical protein